MRGPHNIWRLIRTGATFQRTGAMGAALDALSAPPRVRAAARIMGWPFAWLGYAGDPALPPVTRAITALGPAYIKFGQILSTRPDVVALRSGRPVLIVPQGYAEPAIRETAVVAWDSSSRCSRRGSRNW